MQYEVYLDVLFLENMMMDFLILLAVKKVFPCSATYGSLLAGSVTGSLLTCAILFFPCPVWTRYILLFFLVNSCMTVIGLKIRTFPVFFKAWILLYLASFLLGGIMSWLRLYFGKFFRIISFLFTLGICGFFLLYHGLLFLKKLWKSQDHSFDVILTVNGKDFHLKAFLDSGNHLSDPLTGKPVHIISKDACQKISSQISPGRLRYIPYRTIQKTTSILPVFSVKKMRITGESEFLIQSPLIGISEQKNFGNGKYEMLLHPEDC